MNAEIDKLNLDDLAGKDQSLEDDVEMPAEKATGFDPLTSSGNDSDGSPKSLDAIYDVPVQVSAVLGKTSMPINQLIKLGRGAILELDRKVGESIDVVVNNRLVARGEVVIVDERIGITMTEIIKSDG